MLNLSLINELIYYCHFFSRITTVDVEKRPSDDDEATSAALSSSPTWTLPLEVRYLRQYALENNDWHEFQVRQRKS